LLTFVLQLVSMTLHKEYLEHEKLPSDCHIKASISFSNIKPIGYVLSLSVVNKLTNEYALEYKSKTILILHKKRHTDKDFNEAMELFNINKEYLIRNYISYHLMIIS